MIYFSISHSKAKNKDSRRGPDRKHRNDRSERPTPPRDYNRSSDTVGKFHGLPPFPPAKRYKPGPPDHRCDPYSGRSHEVSNYLSSLVLGLGLKALFMFGKIILARYLDITVLFFPRQLYTNYLDLSTRRTVFHESTTQYMHIRP